MTHPAYKQGDRVECDLAFSPITLRPEAELPEGYIAGVASTPSVDRHGHRVLAKAFDDSIKSKGLSGPDGVQLLAAHDWTKVAGKITKLETVKDNLLLEGQLYLDVGYVKDLYTVLKHNGGLNFSVGFALEEFEFVEDTKSADDPWLIVKRGDLMEVSIVTFPSQREARMTYVKELDSVSELEAIADFERAIIADGICNSRNQAHRLALWAKKNVHLLQPKTPLLVGDGAASPHPVLDASLLKPMADLLAKARACLP